MRGCMRRSIGIMTIIAAAALLGAAQAAESGDTMVSGTKATTASAQKKKVFSKRIEKKVRLGYLLHLPEGYTKSKQKWPLVLFLHGAGERGKDLDKVKMHGPPKLVEDGKDLPFILVSPQCPEGRFWDPEELVALLNDIESSYRVDTNRVYLTGLSMGGYGTWALATLHPKRFAAAVPVCGGGMAWAVKQMKDVPVWAFHGAKDNVVPLRESEEMVAALKAGGGDAKLTVYPDAMHDSWTATYDNPEVWDWMLAKKRLKK
jgi:predicted peptidase